MAPLLELDDVSARYGPIAALHGVSLALFSDDLSPTLRRFATAESLAHLERLVHEGRAAREGLAYVTAASAEHIPAAAP